MLPPQCARNGERRAIERMLVIQMGSALHLKRALAGSTAIDRPRLPIVPSRNIVLLALQMVVLAEFAACEFLEQNRNLRGSWPWLVEPISD
jgi:hypothetical protein